MTGLRKRLAGRMLLGASFVAMGLAAQPALAQERARHLFPKSVWRL